MLHSCAVTCKCIFHTKATNRSQDQGLDLAEAWILAFKSPLTLKLGLAEYTKITKSPECSRSYSHDLIPSRD
jgi:hypothetical protein